MTNSRVTAIASRWIMSPRRRRLGRWRAEAWRHLRGRPHELHYFHRVDDPYCPLMLDVLPGFARRFGATLVPHVISSLDPQMYPAPARLRQHARTDAASLAVLYDIDYRDAAGPCEPGSARPFARYLAGVAADGDAVTFFEQARRCHADYCAGADAPRVRSIAMADACLAADAALLKRRGHYLSATVLYGGEWYWGLDRLDHLERRLIGLGLAENGDEIVRFDRTWRGIMQPVGAGRAGTLELFVSLRSPYSYIAWFQAQKFAAAHGLELAAKPVLPMVMRGLAVPLAKRLYILTDAKREAQKNALDFGAVADPLGAGVERAYAVAWQAAQSGRLSRWFDSAFRAVAVDAIDMATDQGLRLATSRAGIDWCDVNDALADDRWRDWVGVHREELDRAGLWGVPCLRCRGVVTWGQDRFWVIRQALATPSS